MKKYLFTLLLTLCFGIANASIYTVDNNLNSGAMFTSLQAAIDSADAGDTILVSGSGTSYGTIEIYKKLILIGAGYNPNNQTGLASTLGNVWLDSISGESSARESVITGFIISIIFGGYSYLTPDITLERNKISQIQLSNIENWMIRHNIIGLVNHQNNNVSNLIMTNNIFNSYQCLQGWGDNTSTSIVVTNNLFTSSGGGYVFFGAAQNMFFNNNIFYGISPRNASSTSLYWSNNISYLTTNDTIYLEGTNSGSGNMINTDPEFEYVENIWFDYKNDYHLQTGSHGENAGTDGTDIGIYGTTYPLPGEAETPWQTSAMPKIPQLIEVNIKNPSIPINGTLQIQINARKND